jgi:tetratricopeptide (TPR) repeat protein
LAGELGDVAFLVKIAPQVEGLTEGDERTGEVLLLAEAFASTRDFSRALHYYRLVIAGPANTLAIEGGAPFSRRARLGLARLYRQAGWPYEEEQVLREGLLVEADQGVFLRQLFELSLVGDHSGREDAKVWLARFRMLPQLSAAEGDILQARLLATLGERRSAEEILLPLLGVDADNDPRPTDKNPQVIRQAGLLLAEILLEAGELAAAEQQCLAIPGAESDLEVLALLQVIYLRAGETDAVDKVMQGLQFPPDGIRLLQVAEVLERRGLSQSQAALADKVLLDWPDSLRAGLIKAEALARENDYAEALQVAVSLAARYPDSVSVMTFLARLHFQAGQYREAVALAKSILGKEPDRFDIKYLLVCCEMARGNQIEATRLVQELFPETGSLQLAKRLTESGLPMPAPRPRTLWQMVTFDRPAFDLGEAMLKPGAFLDQSRPENKRVNELLTAMSIRLRWEKKFRAALHGKR